MLVVVQIFRVGVTRYSSPFFVVSCMKKALASNP